MRTILLTLLLLVSSLSFASTPKLQSGDIILLPMSCYLCKMIEAETDGPYSHSGIIIKDRKEELFVLQSLETVHALPLSQFLRMKDPNREPKYLRAKELIGKDHTNAMISAFNNDFAGKEFDHDYLWDNLDSEGNEQFYCSEFVTKFINRFLKEKLIPERTYYNKYPEYWNRYFNGNVPNGVIGNNPNTFLKYEQFIMLN